MEWGVHTVRDETCYTIEVQVSLAQGAKVSWQVAICQKQSLPVGAFFHSLIFWNPLAASFRPWGHVWQQVLPSMALTSIGMTGRVSYPLCCSKYRYRISQVCCWQGNHVGHIRLWAPSSSLPSAASWQMHRPERPLLQIDLLQPQSISFLQTPPILVHPTHTLCFPTSQRHFCRTSATSLHCRV